MFVGETGLATLFLAQLTEYEVEYNSELVIVKKLYKNKSFLIKNAS